MKRRDQGVLDMNRVVSAAGLSERPVDLADHADVPARGRKAIRPAANKAGGRFRYGGAE